MAVDAGGDYTTSFTKEDAMLLYKFCKAHGWRMAVTTKEDGSNLPKEQQPWIPFGTVNIERTDGPRVGIGSAEVISGVEKDGFFILGGG